MDEIVDEITEWARAQERVIEPAFALLGLLPLVDLRE